MHWSQEGCLPNGIPEPWNNLLKEGEALKKKITWLDTSEKDGEWLFSFDKKKIFNMFKDYPQNLTKKQKEIFDKENPYWAEFFKDRTQEQ